MKTTLFLLVAILTLSATAAGVKIEQAEYGSKWPFTVSEVTLICKQPGAVVVLTAKGMYALNGLGMSHFKQAKHYSREIRKPDPRVPGTYMDDGDFLERGLELCK